MAGVTPIRGNPEQTMNSIVGYDANSLYLWCTSQNMPCGRPSVYRRTSQIGELKRDFDPDISKQQNMWLSNFARAYSDLQYGIKKWQKANRTVNVKS